MYINAKMDKGNDIKHKAKNASVVFEEQKMQNKYNSIHLSRNIVPSEQECTRSILDETEKIEKQSLRDD